MARYPLQPIQTCGINDDALLLNFACFVFRVFVSKFGVLGIYVHEIWYLGLAVNGPDLPSASFIGERDLSKIPEPIGVSVNRCHLLSWDVLLIAVDF